MFHAVKIGNYERKKKKKAEAEADLTVCLSSRNVYIFILEV